MSSSTASPVPSKPARQRLLSAREAVPDPCDRRGVCYPLAGVPAVEHLSEFGLTRAKAPDESPLRKFARIDADALDLSVGQWMGTRTSVVDGRRVITLDAKTVRGACSRPDGKAPHLIARAGWPGATTRLATRP